MKNKRTGYHMKLTAAERETLEKLREQEGTRSVKIAILKVAGEKIAKNQIKNIIES